MADEFIPELTLDPTSPAEPIPAPAAPEAIPVPEATPAAPAPEAAPAVTEMPEVPKAPQLGGTAAAAAEAVPSLTVDAVPTQAAAAAEALPDSDLDESKLTPAELAAVEDFSRKIDITDSNLVLQYGAAAQKKVSDFSESTLNQVRTKDLGEIGDTLTSLVKELKTFGGDGEEKKGIAGFFHRKKDQLATMKAGYDKVDSNVDRITETLEQHQIALMKDVANLDQMYNLNAEYQKELTMYIIAGKKRLREIEAGELAELKARATETGAQDDAQAYNDMANLCNRFEKKIHDLELTRMITIQMGPQTRLLQNNDTLMIEKIQSSLVNTIPLWKSQMVLAMGLEHSHQATAAQGAVTEMTNALLKKNAEMLKIGTVETAREAERAVVDLETLQHTNQLLVDSLDEVMRIQHEGAQKRREAEAELGRIEGELKKKLLELRG